MNKMERYAIVFQPKTGCDDFIKKKKKLRIPCRIYDILAYDY